MGETDSRHCSTDQSIVTPVFRENGAFQNNLLKQLDELIGQVGSHEGLHCHRDLLRVLGFRQRRLYNLQSQTSSCLIMGPNATVIYLPGFM